MILLVASCLGNWVQLQLGEQPDLSIHLFSFHFFFSAAVHEHSLFAANGERIGTSYVLQEGVNVTVTLKNFLSISISAQLMTYCSLKIIFFSSQEHQIL